jgi:hypothetical protein
LINHISTVSRIAVGVVVMTASALSARVGSAQSTSGRDSSTIAPGSGIARLTSLLIGNWHQPTCGVAPPAGDFVWYPNGDYCEWSTKGRGTVGAQRDEMHRVHIIRLDRQTSGEANARAVVDSIDKSLRSWGLDRRECGSGSTPAGETRASLYARSDLMFFISEITPPSGNPRLLALAVDNPHTFPEALCRTSGGPGGSPTPTPNSSAANNDIAVTLPSGTVVHVRNVVVVSGQFGKSLTLFIQTPTPQSQSKQLASEASELVNRWSDFAKRHGADRVIVAICRTQACLDMRETATEMFRFDRNTDGGWQPKPIDG